jgi:hypothetical protein
MWLLTLVMLLLAVWFVPHMAPALLAGIGLWVLVRLALLWARGRL